MVKLLFCGDIILEKKQKITFSEEMAELMRKSNIRCCNFEGVSVNDTDTPIKKIGPTIEQCSGASEIVMDMGFNLINLANNHIYDYGIDALKRTLNEFSDVATIGAGDNLEDVYRPYIVEIDEKKIAFVSVAEDGFGCASRVQKEGFAWIFHERVKENIKKLKKECDYVIMISHAGLEDCNYPLPEWRNTYRYFIDLGVDVVIAHHPHVIQGWEEYKGKPIFYSLGNFIWQKQSYNDINTIMVEVNLLDKGAIDYKVHYVQCKDFCIEECADTNFIKKVEEYNTVLNDEEQYYARINAICVELMKSQYYGYYQSCLGIWFGDSFKSKVYNILKIMLKRIKPNELFFYHNLCIESHDWTCQRAMSLILSEVNKH